MTACARRWMAEASRDGRLTPQEDRAFCKHIETCGDCARERNDLEALGERLRALSPNGTDSLSVMRRRRVLIEAFAATLLSEPKRPSIGRFWLPPAVIAVLSLLTVQATRRPPERPSVPEPSVKLQASPGARWSQTALQHNRTIKLSEGKFVMTIDRGSNANEVLVLLPDGRLDDFGTVLTVRVQAGRTVSIVVHKGEVTMHLDGKPYLRVHEGEEWPSRTEEPVSTIEEVTPDSNSAKEESVRAVPRPQNTPSRLAHSTRPGSRKAAAESSDNEEDSDYLRIIQLLQTGHAAAAKGASREYLLRHPNGFRRVEVLNIVAGAAAAAVP